MATDCNNNNNQQAIVVALQDLAHNLEDDNQNENVSRQIQKLKDACAPSSPEAIMDVLAPLLFRDDNANPMAIDDDNSSATTLLTSSQALSILVCLVTHDAATFLDAAARGVARAASQMSHLVVSPALLQVISSQITGTADVQVSEQATKALVACCQKIPSLTAPALELLGQAWIAAWQQIQQSANLTASQKTLASTLCVRCASVVVDLMLALDDDVVMGALNTTSNERLLTLFLDMAQDTSDPLVQMTMLDLLERLARETAQALSAATTTTDGTIMMDTDTSTTTISIPHLRIQWLFSKPVLDPLLTLAGGHAEDGEPDPILGGPALRAVAALCQVLGRQSASSSSNNNTTTTSLLLTGFYRALTKFDDSTELDRLAMVDAISSFAMASTEALGMVLQQQANATLLCEAWLSLHVAQPQLKSAILVSMALVLEHDYNNSSGDPAASQNQEEEQTLKKLLYILLGRINNDRQRGIHQQQQGDSTDLLISLTQSPLVEVRLGAYRVLTAAATHIATGAQILLQNAQFFELLMQGHDGKGGFVEERDKHGREAKYALVRAVYQSPAKGLLADAIVQQLETVLERGPHYVKAQMWELATE